MPASTIGGGFVSRCVFVYADRKEAFIAYPDEFVRPDHEDFGARLRADLEHISTALVGPFLITEQAREWGRQWYKHLWSTHNTRGTEEHVNAYIARKQTRLHKLSMILSVSRGDDMRIELEDLALADKMLQASGTGSTPQAYLSIENLDDLAKFYLGSRTSELVAPFGASGRRHESRLVQQPHQLAGIGD
jgi:hypothetical protein